jgi:predicted dehydrogenase
MRRSNSSELVTIASRRAERASQLAKMFGVQKAYGTYEEVLSDSNVDAVYIPLPNHLHVPWTIRCVESGKHVLCEKPIALSVEECETLIAARDKAGVKVGEAFAYKHHPQWSRVRELLRDDRIGEIRALVSEFGFHIRNPKDFRNFSELGGGAMNDLGCYPISLARGLFEAEPVSIVAQILPDPVTQVDRLSSGILEFSTGHCVFTCGLWNSLNQNVKIIGTKGKIQVQHPFIPDPLKSCQLLIDSGSDPWGGGTTVEEIEKLDQFVLQIDHFSSAILNDGVVSTPLEDSLRNTKAVQAVIESAHSRREVRL